MKMQLFVCKICYDSFATKGALTLALHTKYKHKRKPVQFNSPFLKWLWNPPSKAEKESCDDDIDQLIASLYHPIKVPRHAVQPSCVVDARQKKKRIPRIPKVVHASPAKRKPKAKKSKPKAKKPNPKPTKKKKPKPPQVKSRETSFLSPPPSPLADFPRERRKRPIGPSSILSKKEET